MVNVVLEVTQRTAGILTPKLSSEALLEDLKTKLHKRSKSLKNRKAEL